MLRGAIVSSAFVWLAFINAPMAQPSNAGGGARGRSAPGLSCGPLRSMSVDCKQTVISHSQTGVALTAHSSDKIAVLHPLTLIAARDDHARGKSAHVADIVDSHKRATAMATYIERVLAFGAKRGGQAGEIISAYRVFHKLPPRGGVDRPAYNKLLEGFWIESHSPVPFDGFELWWASEENLYQIQDFLELPRPYSSYVDGRLRRAIASAQGMGAVDGHLTESLWEYLQYKHRLHPEVRREN